MNSEFNPSFWKKERVLLTGGGGFLGSFVHDFLRPLSPRSLAAPRSSEFDLRTERGIQGALNAAKPTLVIHVAGSTGGIAANQAHPADYFFDNAAMGILLMENVRRAGVRKFVQVGTVCSYPKNSPVPFRESDLWSGYPEETNAPYGLAKKMLIVQGQAYRKQHGFNSIHLLLANLYGPRDNFDLETSHTIPALIRKCLDARENKRNFIEVWGSGKPTREFLYVEDASRAILLASEKYNEGEPVNIGTGKETSIKKLVELVAHMTGFSGEIRWNTKRPDGQPRRSLDVSRAEKAFGYRAKTPIEVGLKNTLDWYRRSGRVEA